MTKITIQNDIITIEVEKEGSDVSNPQVEIKPGETICLR